MSEALPCPFCGGESAVTSYRSCDCCGKAYNGSVSCTACEAAISHLDTDGEAIAKWNARATLPAWQPIATAPKDGAWVLIPDTRYSGRGVMMARWDDQQNHRRPKPYWSLINESIHGIGASRAHQPEWWMPLPTPPEVQS